MVTIGERDASSWEPEDGETIEYRAARKMPEPLIGVYEVCVTDLVEYDVPDNVPEWQWV